MTHKVHVEFEVQDVEKFQEALRTATNELYYDAGGCPLPCLGYRAGDSIDRRSALQLFVDQMETKLCKNEHKSTWRSKPIVALLQLMEIELAEFKVALEHFSVGEARAETPDIANFAMMIWDRLGQFDQDKSIKVQSVVVDVDTGLKS
jgi:hypothetical protein